MIDGIKLECQVADLSKWNRALDLIGHHSEATGEVIPIAEAKVNGCTFSRAQSAAVNKYIFQGSLHRFYRRGKNNATDFNIDQLRDAVNYMQDTFGIDPERSKVINFEFGINVHLPDQLNSQDFQKLLVSAGARSFEKLNPKKPKMGYKAAFDEYEIKVYDKGKQATTGEKNKLRVEVKVNRTRWLNQFDFNKGQHLYLSDLTTSGNLTILGDILKQKSRSLILTPRSLDEERLTYKQRLTFRECRDPRSWEEWSPRQRQRKRTQLTRIFESVNQANPADVLERLVTDKWTELTTIRRAVSEPKVRGKGHIFHLIVGGYHNLFRFAVWLFANRSHYPDAFNKMLHYPSTEPLQGYREQIQPRARSPPK